MSSVVPHRFLFRYRIPVPYRPEIPHRDRPLLNLPQECTLPDFGELDGQPPFGELRAAWNENGVGISVTVRGKRHPVVVRKNRPDESDGLRLWIDTRNTQSIHRASRFCHRFCVMPAGKQKPNPSGRRSSAAIAIQLPIARAREDAPLVDSGSLPASVHWLADGYMLEVWLPAEALNGYDPQASPFLGFYYHLRDHELGEQYATVGPEFPFDSDPSLWCTLELVRD